jgi:hypothetical protein
MAIINQDTLIQTVIDIDPLGAALKDAGHLGGASKGGALRASNSIKLKQTIKNIQKTPNKNFTSKNSNTSGKAEKKKAILQQIETLQYEPSKRTLPPGSSILMKAKGGRAGYKHGGAAKRGHGCEIK